MKIITAILSLVFLASCSDFEAPSSDDIKHQIRKELESVGISKHLNQFNEIRESLSSGSSESLTEFLSQSDSYANTRIWSWFTSVQEAYKSGNLNEAYSLIEKLEKTENIESYEEDLLNLLTMALDNKSGKSDIAIFQVFLDSDFQNKYNEEIMNIMLGVAILAFNPHGGLF